MPKSNNSDQADISDETNAEKRNDKEDIRKKIASGHYTLSSKVIPSSQSASKSAAWQHFNEIVDSDGFSIKGFVSCKKCQKILKHDSKITGTSSLNRHVKNCKGDGRTTSRHIGHFFKAGSSDSDYKSHSSADKDLITKKCVEFVCRDLRSFKSIRGKGFLELAQCFINVGADKGKVNADELIPHPTTISRQITKTAEPLRIKLYKQFNAALKTIGGAITLDLWTDNYRKIDYLCLTCHFITDDWTLNSKVLCTTEWDADLRKTSENVRQRVVNILTQMGLQEYFTSIIFVTDRGTNLIGALKSATRLDCSAHVLNTVLSTVFTSCEAIVAGMVVAAKRLVQYFKQTGLQKRLDTTLKAQVETRWNTMYDMFESISKNYEKITTILVDRNTQDFLNDIPLEVVNTIVDFLSAFTEASKDLQKDKEPTLHTVVAWKKILTDHMQPDEEDSDWMAALKVLGLQTLQSKMRCKLLQKVAFFLNPYTKGLTAIEGDEDIPAIYDKVRQLVEAVIMKEHRQTENIASTSSQSSQKEQSSTLTNPRKRKRFSVLDVADKLPEDNEKDEVQKYIELLISKPKNDEENFDLLNWWKDHSNIFPFLSKVARFILAIPASSAPSERDFSNAGFVLQPRRSKLNPSKVDNILFLHSNLF